MSDHFYNLGPVISHGVWVVRWIDEIPAESATGDDPQLRFRFSRLYNPNWRAAPFAQAIAGPPRPGRSKSSPPTVVEPLFTNLHAGALTELRPGMVVEDGRPIARLRAEERDITVRLPDALPGTRHGLCPANTPLRDILGIESSASLMPVNGYRHGCRPDTLVTVFYDPSTSGRALVIPSSEVIRAFLAPVSDVARDLVRLPPPEQLQGLIRSGTCVTPEGHWRLDLAETISARHAPLMANLHEPFSPVGAMAAAQVFFAKQDDLLAGHSTARLAGMIPFTDCTLRFRARVIPLSDHHDLCLEILQVTWPYPDRPQIEVVRWKPEMDPAHDPERVPGLRFQTRPGWETEIDPDNDPDHRSDVTTFSVEGVVWEAMPKPKPVEMRFRPDADRQVVPGETRKTDVASLGASTGGTHLPAGSLSQIPNGDVAGEPCPRFAAAVTMLAELKRNRAISNFELVPAPPGHREAKRGDLSVWRLGPEGDRAPAWFWMNKVLGVRRTMLICKVTLCSGQAVYWMEVEPSSSRDVYSALLVAPNNVWDATAIGFLVERIEEDERVTQIEKDPEWMQRGRIRRWFHLDASEPLDGGRALADMAALVAGA